MTSGTVDVDLAECVGPRRFVRMRTSSGETQTVFPNERRDPMAARSKQRTENRRKPCPSLSRSLRPGHGRSATSLSEGSRTTEVLASIGLLLFAACVDRPQAQGLPGRIEVYAQGPEGPFQLRPRQMHPLLRPQKLAFRWVPAGGGPRIIRIRAVPDRGEARVLHEARVGSEPHYLDWLLKLDARGPSRFRLETEVVSPHDQPIRTRYGIRVRDGPG